MRCETGTAHEGWGSALAGKREIQRSERGQVLLFDQSQMRNGSSVGYPSTEGVSFTLDNRRGTP